jgi:hypothetical protein|tara:strand:- start:217 stop:804 length:588 start_codon:yes stop_codon:yes gene_type:complete
MISILTEKGTKMIKLFAIKVKDTITCRKSGNSADSESYVKKFNEDRNRLEMTSSPKTFYNSRKEALEAVEDLPVSYNGSEFTNKYSYSIESVTYKYANHIGYSDVNPYEIVKVISDKTIEIRIMDATRDKSWKPEVISGGFAGRCVNQHSQRWDIVSNDDVPTVRARLRKDGYYHSSHGKHLLGEEPRKFYDYNF